MSTVYLVLWYILIGAFIFSFIVSKRFRKFTIDIVLAILDSLLSNGYQYKSSSKNSGGKGLGGGDSSGGGASSSF